MLKVYKEYKELPSDSQVDVVYVALTHKIHKTICAGNPNKSKNKYAKINEEGQ